MAEKYGLRDVWGGTNESIKKIPKSILKITRVIGFGSLIILSSCASVDNNSEIRVSQSPLENGMDSVNGVSLSEKSRDSLSLLKNIFEDLPSAVEGYFEDSKNSLEVRRIEHFTKILFEFIRKDSRQGIDESKIQEIQKKFEAIFPKFGFEIHSLWTDEYGVEQSKVRQSLEEKILYFHKINQRAHYLRELPEYFDHQGRLKTKILFTLFLLQNVHERPVQKRDIEEQFAVFNYETLAIARSLSQLIFRDAAKAETQTLIPFARGVFEGFRSSEGFIHGVEDQAVERISTVEKTVGLELNDIRNDTKQFLAELEKFTSFTQVNDIVDFTKRGWTRITNGSPRDLDDSQEKLKGLVLQLLNKIDSHPALVESNKKELRLIVVFSLVGAVAFNERLMSSVQSILRVMLIPSPF